MLSKASDPETVYARKSTRGAPMFTKSLDLYSNIFPEINISAVEIPKLEIITSSKNSSVLDELKNLCDATERANKDLHGYSKKRYYNLNVKSINEELGQI